MLDPDLRILVLAPLAQVDMELDRSHLPVVYLRLCVFSWPIHLNWAEQSNHDLRQKVTLRIIRIPG